MKLFKFYKDKCAPCYVLERQLVNEPLPEYVELVKMNVGDPENLRIAKEHGFETVPVLMFEDGRTLKGKVTREELHNFIWS